MNMVRGTKVEVSHRVKKSMQIDTKPSLNVSVSKNFHIIFPPAEAGKMIKLGLFVVFNSILPFTDVATDGITFFDLLENGHTNWAAATFYFMWNPFILHLLTFIKNIIKAWWEGDEDFAWQAELKEVFLHLPFVVPIKNIYNAYRLFQMGFGTEQMDETFWEEVEKIQYEAGMIGMQESFMEAGPQSVVQLVIVFSTGRISTAQMVSIPLSIFSLAWASSRVFFILRKRDEADPDPKFKLVALRILPWELLIVANSIILWTLIGGLLGKYIFIGIPFSFATIYGILYMKERGDKLRKEEREALPEVHDDYEYLSMEEGIDGPEANSREAALQEANRDFKFVSALTSIWLPSVVGHSKSNFFIIASLVSLINKLILLTIAILLDTFTNIDTNPLLIWCKASSTVDLTIIGNSTTESGVTYCQFPATTLPSCWDPDQEGLLHKIRICGEYEDSIRLVLILLVVISTALSTIASYHLHTVSNYVQLYEKTKTFLCCVPTKPEVHRSVIFDLTKDDSTQKQLEEMLESSKPSMENQANPMVNRPNHEGETPLHNSTKARASKCTEVLLKAGAVPRKNSRNEFPQVGSQLYNNEVLSKLITSKEMGLLPQYVLAELESQTRESSTLAVSDVIKFKQKELFLDGSDFRAKGTCTLWNYKDDGSTTSKTFCKVDGNDFLQVRDESLNLFFS